MKLIILLLTLGFMQVYASTYGQQVTLNLKNVPLSQLFREIRKQTNYDFIYNDNLIRNKHRISLQVKNKDVKEVLRDVLKLHQLQFNIIDNSISIEAIDKEYTMIETTRQILTQQQSVIQGTVVNEKNKPIAGALVWLKTNDKVGTPTDHKGTFTLTIPTVEARLVIYSMGYEKMEISSKELSKNNIIRLIPKANNLEDIQVMGYGTTTKRLNAGNITTITAKEIEKNPVNNVLAAIQGKVPGLYIQQNSGHPGGSFDVRLRNAANLASGPVAPLFIIDGVRYPAGELPQLTSGGYTGYEFFQGGNGLNFINPNDIERIDVLKDIDATSIFGSSGAYGVILITTKKSKSGATAFNANIYSGLTVLGKTAPLLNTEQYLELRREAIANDGKEPGPLDLDVNGTWPQDRYTNWRKELLGSSAATHNINIAYSGGSENTNYRFGSTFTDIGNIQMNKGYDRKGSLSMNLNSNTPDKKLNFSFSGNYMAATNTMIPIDFSSLSSSLVPNSPPLFLPDGSINWDELIVSSNTHPIANIHKTINDHNTNLISNLILNYKPTDNLTFHSTIAFTERNNRKTSKQPSTVFHPATKEQAIERVATLDIINLRNFTISPYVQYRKTIAQKGSFSFQLGGEINNNLTKMLSTSGLGFSNDALLGNPYIATNLKTDNISREYRSIGTYAISKFIWDNKYIANINIRRDGSTKFGPGRRFGTFGSGALAWIFSEEKFIKNNFSWLNYGKLRVSSGSVGGDAVGDYGYLDNYRAYTGTGSYDGTVALLVDALSNPFLEWEKNFNTEFGLELGFLNNRITTDISYYLNRAGNQLLNTSVSAVTGFNNFQRNTDAVILNKGLEILFSSSNIESKNFSWSTRFNISLPNSKILKLPTQHNNVNYKIDESPNGVLVYNYLGVNPQTGLREYKNAKGEVKSSTTGFTQNDRTEFINLDPYYFGGIQNTFRYKRISLDFTFSFTKRMGQSMIAQEITTIGHFGTNGSVIWLDRWQKPGDVTDVPKLTSTPTEFYMYSFNISSGAYEELAFAKLQNLSLRYSLNPDLLKKLHLKQLAIYFQGQNLFTISKYGGLDPENLNSRTIGPTRIFTAGLNFTL